MTESRLVDLVLKALTDRYVNPKGEVIQGNSISFVHQELRYDGVRNLPSGDRFEDLLTGLGFTIMRDARSVRPNQRATIVTL